MNDKLLYFLLSLYICLLICLAPSAFSSSPNRQTDLAELVKNHTEFTFSLYSKLDESDANLVFSPHSIATCLSMAYIGARDLTEEQMRQALNLNFSPKELPAVSALLQQSLLPDPNKKTYELHVANALWLDEKAYILANYRYAIEQQFAAKVSNINFSEKQQTLSAINQWISEQTCGHIQNVLTQGDITASTKILLTNAAYFKGSFQKPFNPKSTSQAPFTLSSNASQMTSVMQQTAQFPYMENELLQAVALPFNGISQGKGQWALLILLPKSKENFNPLLQMMPTLLSEVLTKLQKNQVHLELPKFSLSKRYMLNAPLQSLGMKNPFTTQANFSGIDGRLDLYLNKVAHETYFALDEYGVTAAAVTVAGMSATAMPEQPPIEFIADHPFMFFIVELKSQEVVFIGKFSDPTDSL